MNKRKKNTHNATSQIWLILINILLYILPVFLSSAFAYDVHVYNCGAYHVHCFIMQYLLST